jgi:hypothetical protein
MKTSRTLSFSCTSCNVFAGAAMGYARVDGLGVANEGLLNTGTKEIYKPSD